MNYHIFRLLVTNFRYSECKGNDIITISLRDVTYDVKNKNIIKHVSWNVLITQKKV
jgi:ABC-type molybdenum transport system ATPase subunit/photorepair protein PhrA